MFAVASKRVVTPKGLRDAAILIDREKINAVVDRVEVPSNCELREFGDLVISPGIVDAHVHINEPGRTEWEGFATATAAAAAGGVTTLIDMPLNSSPVTTNDDALRQKRSAAAGKCYVDVAFYGGLIPNNGNELGSLLAGGVHGIKAFLCDSGIEEFPAATESDLRAALTALKPTGVPLLAHAELTTAATVPPIETPTSYTEYAASRPPEFELAAIELLISLCREFDSPIHIVHLATARALPLIESAKSEGLPLTVETCPHYLLLSMDQIEDGQTEFKCAPPIRDEANRRALCEAVGSGLIDTIGSDHSPCPPELKQQESGDFQRAWGGIAGLQLTLPVCWTVGRDHGWSPELLSQRLSHGPAEIFGLGKRKGSIQPGIDADLVVWDPDAEFTVTGSQLIHRHKLTPYEGIRLRGVVRETYRHGQRIFADDVVDSEPRGLALRRNETSSTSIAERLNDLMAAGALSTELEKCCASRKWIERMASSAPFDDDPEVLQRARDIWADLQEPDFLEAFAAHPRIGDINTLREKYANTKEIAGGEQSSVQSASEDVLRRLASANDEYFEKNSFIFIVCATGKSAVEMLKILERRLENDRATEISNAAAEQLKITRIRLRKLAA